MRTLAHALIQRRYVEKGMTTRFITLPIPDSGLPQSLVEAGQPVTLDILAGRPVNLELSDAGLRVDLCFSGPPQRCRLPWHAILATQDLSGDLVQTTVVTVATVMEDSSLVAAQPPEELLSEKGKGEEASTPPIAVLGGGRPPRASGEPSQRRPKLRLVSSATDDEPPPRAEEAVEKEETERS